MRLLFAIALTSAVALTGCSGSGGGTLGPSSAPPSAGPEILPLLVNSEITKGSNRFLFSLTDRANKLVAAPDVKVHLLFYDVDTAANTVAFEADSRFLWAVEGAQGLYVANVTFPDAGRWGTRFEATFPDRSLKTVRADYDVRETGTTPAIGAPAPSVDTPTAADVGGNLSLVSTDKEPEPRFYETSVADAITRRMPFVLSFATPAFCETRLCGPTLETVKSVARGYPDVTFINLEPYKMKAVDGRLQPEVDANSQLQPAAWTTAWGLPSEPYTFVVGAEGRVAAKFEGVLAEDELRAAIDAL